MRQADIDQVIINTINTIKGKHSMLWKHKRGALKSGFL